MVTPSLVAVPVPLCRELCSGQAGTRNHCPHVPHGHSSATTGAQQNLLIPHPRSPTQIPTSLCARQNRLFQSRSWFGSGFVYSLRQNDATAPPWEGCGAGMGWLAPVNQQPWKITAGGLGGWKRSVLIGMFRLLRAFVLDPRGQVTAARTPRVLFPLHLLLLSSLGLVRGLVPGAASGAVDVLHVALCGGPGCWKTLGFGPGPLRAHPWRAQDPLCHCAPQNTLGTSRMGKWEPL